MLKVTLLLLSIFPCKTEPRPRCLRVLAVRGFAKAFPNSKSNVCATFDQGDFSASKKVVNVDLSSRILLILQVSLASNKKSSGAKISLRTYTAVADHQDHTRRDWQ